MRTPRYSGHFNLFQWCPVYRGSTVYTHFSDFTIGGRGSNNEQNGADTSSQIAAKLELEKLKRRVAELETQLGLRKQRGLKFTVRFGYLAQRNVIIAYKRKKVSLINTALNYISLHREHLLIDFFSLTLAAGSFLCSGLTPPSFPADERARLSHQEGASRSGQSSPALHLQESAQRQPPLRPCGEEYTLIIEASPFLLWLC